MFRLQDNTPSVYTEQSRDFQLFCRLYDCIFNGVKYDIDSITDILDPNKINDRLLGLLCTKIGFFTSRTYDSYLLRHILVAFPYAVKSKGSIRGIQIAVSTILKAEGDLRLSSEASDVRIDYREDLSTIYIYTSVPVINTHALDDFLKYILPVGYTYILERYIISTHTKSLGISDSYIGMINPTSSLSQIRGTDRIKATSVKDNQFNFRSDIEDRYIGTINSSRIIGTLNNLQNNEYALDRNSTNRDTIDSSTAKRDGQNQVELIPKEEDNTNG